MIVNNYVFIVADNSCDCTKHLKEDEKNVFVTLLYYYNISFSFLHSISLSDFQTL